MSLLKKLGLSVFLLTTVTACVSTAAINQESEAAYAELLFNNSGAIDKTSPTAQKVHRVFNRMKPIADQENKTGVPFNWEITVFHSDELNAWAMPGGKMAFYDALVNQLQLNDHEVATVMGHEMAHALLEHGKSQRTFSTVTGIIKEVANTTIRTTINDMPVDIVGHAVDLIADKPYSRSHETQADEMGLTLMAKAGYDPSAAPGLWTKMSQQNGGSSGFAIFSTHPSDEARQENLQRLLPEALKIYHASPKAPIGGSTKSYASSTYSSKSAKKSKRSRR